MDRPFPISNFAEYRPSRNPYAARFGTLPAVPPTGFTCSDTEERRGKWRQFFGRDAAATLNLEIGSYHGESLVDLAGLYPDEIFVGTEWKFREAYKAAEKLIRAKRDNACVLRSNVARLPWMFAPGEIDRVWILFPDPWPKTNQQKWRLLQPEFFYILGALLDAGKEVMIKTDHSEYAMAINHAWRSAGCFEPLPEDQADALWTKFPPSPFERIFFRNSEPVFRISLVRNGQQVDVPKPVQHVLS